ncbi:F-box protein At4g09920 isoform X2 [Lathyrus oleraceus]|uniref:F-box domain-containing protein n=1 Tax=Pisum sativum TaxID=3888 RepID=A0A9D5AZD3_PEA|nr:F-box protein At4g09920-like isoform X2 [Pisum sativum]KAI5424671.1 hypothetical protein KIW84_030747 [Pisum sativum]
MAKDTKLKAMVDRISELPDELLSHILSFLPLNFAYTTGLISKRWKTLCKLMIDLHFDDKLVKGEEEFQRFGRCVDKVMLSPDMNNQPIRGFHLNCCHPELLLFDYDQWIEAAKLRGVQDLQLQLSVFPFKTAYEMSKWESRTKSMEDKFISVAPNNIFSCRTLVILKLERLCVAGNILSVHLPLLKTLHLKSVYLQNSDNLKKLISKSLVLEDLYVMVGYKERLDVKRPNEKILSYFKDSLVFRNLIQLDLVFEFFYGWDDLKDMLQNCPNLEVLLIHEEIIPKLQDIVIGCEWTVDVRNGFYTIWKSPNFVPKCISSRLRYCTLTYEGMEDSLRFAEYVLQNARLLQVMTVKTTMFTRSVYHQKILDELNSCPKISPFCKLSIEL